MAAALPSYMKVKPVMNGLGEPTFAEVARACCPLVLPVHPRADSRPRGAGVRIIPPLGCLDFIALEAREVMAARPPPRRPALREGHAGARLAAALVTGHHAA